MQQTNDRNAFAFPIDLAAVVLAMAVFAFSLFVLSPRFLVDPDTYWHIETGRWIWSRLEFPRTDVFSHTAFGKPWTNMEWLSQVVLYFSYALMGWHGPVLLTSLAITLIVLLVYLLLARRLRATVALGTAAVVLTFANIHFIARPHLLSFPVLLVWIAALAKACDEDRRPSFWLLPLMTLWANLHGAFTVGLVLVAGFGFDATVKAAAADRIRVAARWMLFLVCAVAAACINPYGYLYLWETYNVFKFGPVLEQNAEWRSINFQSEIVQEWVLLALLILALTYGVKIRFSRVLMLIGVLHFGLRHVRGLPMLALSWPFILAGPLTAQFPFLKPSADSWPLFDARKTGWRTTSASIATILIAIIALSAVYVRSSPDVRPLAGISPVAAVNYALQNKLDGPVLNDFDFGGYLIHRSIKTFIDGRTLPFGKDFANGYFEALDLKTLNKLEAIADAHKVTWTLWRAGTAPALHFDHSPRWRRVYADDIAVVHVRR